ncbi:unnamed protein product [Phytophthora lilii]|uniref:Unnamed protein product n=1 Tax=Phytophthora lilii TaxID=2077276 RepID=A0A9W6U4N7_9STRA|nr:unnamed protein product [Phytophthora lilii]
MARPLTSALLVLHAQPLDSTSLHHLGLLISSFLGPSANLSLSDAVSVGSIELLDWMSSSCLSADQRPPGWALHNYLRSEPHYYQWQLWKSVPVDVVEESAKQGNLQILQFLLEHDAARYRRHKRRAIQVSGGIIPYESVPQVPAKMRGDGIVVHWDGRSILLAIDNNHPEVAQWLYQNAPHELNRDEVQYAIEYAVRQGAMELAEFLLPRGMTLVDYANDEPHPDVAVMLLNSGYLMKSEEAAAASLRAMICVDRLDLMKQIEQLYSPSPMSSVWARRMVLRHDRRMQARQPSLGGSGPQWARECRWMANEPDPYSAQSSAGQVIETAARNGHLRVLEYFHNLASTDLPVGFTVKPSTRAVVNAWWKRFHDAMSIAAKNGHLTVVQWLHTKHAVSCSSKAMDAAATNGHLEVLRWLHPHRSEDCTTKAMDGAAANGHSEVMQWLHTNSSAGCTTHAVDLAAGRGHLEVLKWLHANRSEGCTIKAVENALQQSNLRALSWLHDHYPQLVLSKGTFCIRAPNQFEVLLFLHKRQPHFFRSDNSSRPGQPDSPSRILRQQQLAQIEIELRVHSLFISLSTTQVEENTLGYKYLQARHLHYSSSSYPTQLPENTTVRLVLHHQAPSDSLEHVGALISSFLGPSPTLSLRWACSFGSLELLDWIWASSCSSPDSRPATWSLHNYLRSEREYYLWQFRKAAEVAAERGVMKWLFAHFNSCFVPVDVVEAAAKNGHLPILKFLLENDAGRHYKHSHTAMVVTSGIVPFESVPKIPEDERGDGIVVHWGGRSMLHSIEHKHVEIARWLYENTPHEMDNDEIRWAVKYSLRVPDMQLALFFLPQGRSIVEFSHDDPHPDMVEELLEAGYTRQDESCAAVAIYMLARVVRLDLMKRIVLLHTPPREKRLVLRDERGVQIRRRAHIEVLQYLHDNDFFYSDNFRDAALVAVRNGHLQKQQWLLDHHFYSSHDFIIEEAARHGHLGIVQFLHSLDMADDIRVLPPFRSIDVAAANGHLPVVEWLHQNRSDGCTVRAMNNAAANGHLEVVKWLHANRREGCTVRAMDKAASNDHLKVVEWLHHNRSEGCTTKAMDLAAANGHLKVLKWLYANRTEGCTMKAFEKAVSNSHLRVAWWMHAHFPTWNPSVDTLQIHEPNPFDILLLLDKLYPQLYDMDDSDQPVLVTVTEPGDGHALAWMRERYSVIVDIH